MSEIPDELNQAVTRRLHDQGIEMTPEEVIAERKKAYAAIRAHLRAKGYTVPDGDLELLKLMKMMGL